MACGLGFDACPRRMRATAPSCRGERLRHKPPQDESQAAELTPSPSQASWRSGTGQLSVWNGWNRDRMTCSGHSLTADDAHRRVLPRHARSSRQDSDPLASSIEHLAVTGGPERTDKAMSAEPISAPSTRAVRTRLARFEQPSMDAHDEPKQSV